MRAGRGGKPLTRRQRDPGVPVVDSAARRLCLGLLQLLAAVSLLAPALGYAVNAVVVALGVGATSAIELGWLGAILGLPTAALGGLLVLASKPLPVPEGDLSSQADRWPM